MEGITHVIDDWLNWLSINRSQATITGYGWEMRHLACCFPGKGAGDFTPAELRQYLADRRKAGCGDAAIKRTVNALRNFFAFACGETSPAADLPMPRPKKRQQRTLKADQALAVLAACDSSSAIGTRDLALMALMLDTGLRAAEVCRLRLDQLAVDSREFKAIVKDGHEKSGVFSSDTANYLVKWLELRKQIARPGVNTVFVGIGGTLPGRPLTTDGLRRIFYRVGQAAGLPNGFSPHDLRRTFATLAHQFGAPTRLVQIAGRWEDINMVTRYTRALTAHDFDPYSVVSALMRR